MKTLIFTIGIVIILGLGVVHLYATLQPQQVRQATPTLPAATYFKPSVVLDTSNWKICKPQYIGQNVTYKYPPDWLVSGDDPQYCGTLNPPDKEVQNQETSVFSLLVTGNNEYLMGPEGTLVAQNSNYELFHLDAQPEQGEWEMYFLVFPAHKTMVGFSNLSHAFLLSAARQRELDIIFSKHCFNCAVCAVRNLNAAGAAVAVKFVEPSCCLGIRPSKKLYPRGILLGLPI